MINSTTHQIIYSSATNLKNTNDNSVQLVITSPPYPMIEMWDRLFCENNSDIEKALTDGDGPTAFEMMHLELDKVWNEVARVTSDGGIVCINIGDATRTLTKNFALYSSHARIISKFVALGLQNLPNIIWRKTTNAPNKFMGSGMLPPGAYVTLEHEYILIFRKGAKREFGSADLKSIRRQCALFWEERNQWFSDVWLDLKGTGQRLERDNLRKRSAAFPFELAFRLINMFSIYGDIVLDPFLGTGTTTMAAMTTARNSIGYEIDESFRDLIDSQLLGLVPFANANLRERIVRHREFMKDRESSGKLSKFKIKNLGLPCVSGQERDIVFSKLDEVRKAGDDEYEVGYSGGELSISYLSGALTS